MTSISERLIEGVQGAIIGAIAGPICYTPGWFLCHYINKKITHIPYIKSLHDPIFASLPFQKILKVIALTSAIYLAFFGGITMASIDLDQEGSTLKQKKNYILIRALAFQFASNAQMVTLRRAGIIGNYMTAFMSLYSVAIAAIHAKKYLSLKNKI